MNIIIKLHISIFIRRKKWIKNFKIQKRLAWNLLSNLCANFIVFLKKIILSPQFLQKSRKSDKDFTRNRKFPFHYLIFFLINFVSGSYRKELNSFFKTTLNLQVSKLIISKAALSKARGKLKPEAFVELNTYACKYFYENFQTLKWHGLNLLACDGTTLTIPDVESIKNHFGVWATTGEKDCPKARVSQLFDVLNKVTIHALIRPTSEGERELAAQHCHYLLPNDLLLLDRGYPAFWLFALILQQGSNFVARISCTQWKIVRQFFNSGRNEKIIKLHAPSSSIKECKDLGLERKPLVLRLVRIPLETGETEILITSLIDKDRYPYDLFAELYHDRWPIEEDYKTIKCRIEVERFTGETVDSVYQDFHAKILSKNITTILAHPVNGVIARETANRKHRYQINFTHALAEMKGTIVLLFSRSKALVKKFIEQLHELFSKVVESVRPGRKFPRNHKRRPKFYKQYKPVF